MKFLATWCMLGLDPEVDPMYSVPLKAKSLHQAQLAAKVMTKDDELLVSVTEA